MTTTSPHVDMPVPGGESEDPADGIRGPADWVPSSETETVTLKEMMRLMKNMMANYEKRLEDMHKEIQQQKNKIKEKDVDDNKLKPINIKDLKLPSEYDGEPNAFMEWHTRFKNAA